MRRAVLSVLAALLLTGCGNERTTVPDLSRPVNPVGTQRVELAGIRFTAPANWTVLGPQGELLGGLQSGTATMAVWRYPRTEPLPADRDALREVRGLLVERVERRDPTFDLDRARLVRRGGADGIELLGRQTINGRRVGVRSAHLFAGGDEVVIDAYAPHSRFEQLDESVFLPLLDSLKLR